MNVLITGNAGFIGMHLTLKLINLGYNVFGVDNLNEYYDVQLKIDRLKQCGINEIVDDTPIKSTKFSNFIFIKMDINNTNNVYNFFSTNSFNIVFHLAAQAGVRYSINNPRSYIENNINGFFNIIDAARIFNVDKFIYASSSSVYGNEKNIPFKETMNVDKPISLYAATKKCDELIAHSYSSIYGLKTRGLRFFTVYGPWGRPDMAYYSFTKSILENIEINLFNEGKLSRDFTFVDDIIDGIISITQNEDILTSDYEIYNIGNNKPIELMSFVEILEKKIGKKAKKKFIQMQNGDVRQTYADITKISKILYNPKIDIIEGVSIFVDWYTKYYS
jgi:UDP-glucuronate 4-epimerase